MEQIKPNNFVSIVDDVLDIATNEIGKHEIPYNSNWGKDVQKYLASVGIKFPASWCMSFVYWCVDKACEKNGIMNPLIKTGGVLKQWNECNPSLKFKSIKVGSIFIIDHGKGLGHAGFVSAINGKYFETIEGNSNKTGSREGNEVCSNTRVIDKCKGFIRLDNILAV